MFVLQYLHDTSAGMATVVVVLQVLHKTSADVTTVVGVLQDLHNTSPVLTTVVVLHDCTTLEMLLLWLLYCCTCMIFQQM